MKTKIVYVLVSNECDIYLEQTLLSVHSAKMHIPDAEIILLTDNSTNVTLTGQRSRILDYVTSKVVVEIEERYTNRQRSRILKTSIAEYVKEDFLFIDSDTIITASLEEADSFDCDIAAVKDLHISLLKKHPNYFAVKKDINKIGESIDENLLYFNSGVFYVKYNERTMKFFKTWNEYWRKGNCNGIDVDQPSFMIANMLNSNIISELPDTWNCQIYTGLKYLYDSKILHYFASKIPFEEVYLAEFTGKDLYMEIKSKGYIDDKTEQILKNPYHYFDPCTLIIYGRDVALWNSFSIRSFRFFHKKCTKLFNIIEFFSKHLFLLTKKFFKP
jgi:hypothetical protein